MIVYVLTMVGVNDQGCCGVFYERSTADDHAQALWNLSDGYHSYRVDELELDVGYYPHGSLKIGPAAEPPPPLDTTFGYVPLEGHGVYGDDDGSDNDRCSCGHIRRYHHVTETAPSTRSIECTYDDCACMVWDPV